MKLIWSPEALQDRIDIWDYISSENPSAAIRMDELFSQSVFKLTQHPKLGRPGKIKGTRELIIHENYRLVYEIQNDAVWLLALVHTSRLWPLRRS
jgi:toxin ParE1/3/4